MFSIKHCEICNEKFKKTSGNQKRCPQCKVIGTKNYIKKYNNTHKIKNRAKCKKYRLKHGLIKGGIKSSWNKGLHWSEGEKKKRSIKLKGKHRPKEIIDKLHEGRRKYVYTNDVKLKMNEKAKRRPKPSKESLLKRRESKKKAWSKPEIRLKQSKELKKRYENPDYYLMMLKNSWNKLYKGGVNRRGMMYIPLNDPFIDDMGEKSERHHLDNVRLIYIPKQFHNALRGFCHNHKIQNTMNYPNFLVLLWIIANNVSIPRMFDPNMNIDMFINEVKI